MDKTLRTRTTGSAYKRPNFATEFKRELVEQTFEPGASVALIARRNEVNANLLFKWRRLYLAGAYGLPTRAEHAVSKLDCEEPALLPVSIVAETPAPAMQAARRWQSRRPARFDGQLRPPPPLAFAALRYRISGLGAGPRR